MNRKGHSKERGAALVEMALITPFLLTLLLGIIEFGYIYGQFNDVRHGAREGARYAAVDGGDNTSIHARVCEAMDLSAGITSLTIELTDGTNGEIGDVAEISVTATVTGLSGAPIISSFIPNSLTSDIEFRLEQPSDSWGDDGAPVSVTC